MTVLHITGKMRTGKGVFATYLGLYVAEAGNPVDCNYHITNPMVRWITFYDLLEFLKKPRQSPPHLLIIDELPGWCDSYVTQAKSSRYATYFLNQSAKLGYDLIFTSQRTMRADINFRELSDARCRAEKNEEHKCFEYHWLDPEETEEDVDTGRVTRIPYELAAQFWERYDTFEAVPPIGLDEILVEMEKYDPQRMNATIERQVSILLGKGELTLAAKLIDVKDALLELCEPVCYAPYVHVRLLRRLRTPVGTETPTAPVTQPELQCLDRWRALRKDTRQ